MLCFLVFRCSIFKVPFATALCDSLFSISYSVPFVKGFFKLFSSFFSTFSSAQSHNLLFLLAFSLSPLPLGHRLPCGALLYYHFLPLLSTPFLSFFPLFSSFLPFLFDVSSFLSLFSRFFGVLWAFLKEKSTRNVLPRQGQTSCLSGSSRKGNVFTFFLLLQKEPKSSRDSVLRPRFKTLLKIFFVAFPAFVPKPVYGTTRFFGCFEPLRKGYCSTDARLMFFENGMPHYKLAEANVSEKGSCSLSLLGANSKLLCVVWLFCSLTMWSEYLISCAEYSKKEVRQTRTSFCKRLFLFFQQIADFRQQFFFI